MNFSAASFFLPQKKKKKKKKEKGSVPDSSYDVPEAQQQKSLSLTVKTQ